MRLAAVALSAVLVACSGEVTTYQGEPTETALGGYGAGGTMVSAGGQGGAADAGVTVPDAPPEPVPDCEGDAMCWPTGFCDAGFCQEVDGGVD